MRIQGEDEGKERPTVASIGLPALRDWMAEFKRRPKSCNTIIEELLVGVKKRFFSHPLFASYHNSRSYREARDNHQTNQKLLRTSTNDYKNSTIALANLQPQPPSTSLDLPSPLTPSLLLSSQRIFKSLPQRASWPERRLLRKQLH